MATENNDVMVLLASAVGVGGCNDGIFDGCMSRGIEVRR